MTKVKNAILGTVIFCNLILLLFVWERQTIVIQQDVPSIAKIKPITMKSDFISEKVGISRHGDYIVEDYQEIQVWYDQKGKVIKRVPTSNHTYLRYWASKKAKIIMDDPMD